MLASVPVCLVCGSQAADSAILRGLPRCSSFSAWARYEDELAKTGGPRHRAALDARNDWGRVARTFLATEA